MASSTIFILSFVALLSLLTTSVFADDRLNAAQSLQSGQSLAQGGYIFIIQNDCNLVLYDNNDAVWASGTNGEGSNCILTMQRDGNLVIYGDSGAIWASNTNRQDGNYYLILQRDRNVVIYDDSNNAIWSTGTNVGDAAIAIVSNNNGTTTASGAARNKVKELYP